MIEYDVLKWESTIHDVLESARVKLHDVAPSVWAEENIVLGAPFPGPLRYSGKTPFTREIIDFLDPSHPGRELAVMGSAQFGKTMTILIPGIGWIINNSPANIIMTVGHKDLIEDAMEKIDFMLDQTGTRRLIKPSAQRAKAQKSGDTNYRKEFPNGFLVVRDASNPKIWRQASYMYGFIDDYDAVRSKSKVAGSTKKLIDKRFNSYDKIKKVIYLSSPELEGESNIQEVYLMGDQRKWMVPCPCCGSYIDLMFFFDDKPNAGIKWDIDPDGKLIEDSVRYVCQECDGSFKEDIKQDIVDRGFWKPTARPFRPEFYSYYMNGLYSPAGMAGWKSYVYSYIEANPPHGKRDESKWQTFLNVDLGLPYSPAPDTDTEGTKLSTHCRNYLPGTVPDVLSEEDGNGKVILLTLVADCNGLEDDARIDWEVVAHCENKSTYSITHGSIGTFIPATDTARLHIKNDPNRLKWTYRHGAQLNVWTELDNILDTVYEGQSGRKRTVYQSGIDSGTHTAHVYAWKDLSRHGRKISLLKGDDDSRYARLDKDVPLFRVGKERVGLYELSGNRLKDRLNEYMNMPLTPRQSPNSMNYPAAGNGLYSDLDFFKHYESEQRIQVKNSAGVSVMRWAKKKQSAQNHFWDVRYMALGLREIIIFKIKKELKNQAITWEHICQLIK